MVNRLPLHAIRGIATVLLTACFAVAPVSARLPWAATSGIHFIEAVVNADNYRMRAAALAMRKSPSLEVRELARMLWEDSVEDTRRLKWVVMEHDPYLVLPTQISPAYMFVLDALVPISGNEFDRRFIEQQVASLSDALALAEGYARAGDDLDLKEFAQASVANIKMELDRIAEIRTRYEALALR